MVPVAAPERHGMDGLNLGRAGDQAGLDNPACGASLAAALGDLLGAAAFQPSQHERQARIVRTIERDIIPRLARAHLPDLGAPAVREGVPVDAAAFARLLFGDDEALSRAVIDARRALGATAEDICQDLLIPAARELGRLWDEDRCSFSDVTVGMGRLQRLLRVIGPELGEAGHLPPDSRRVLLVPAPGEAHTFGLSIVAEFFRREGWDVVCQTDGNADPAALLRAEWFDVVGVSLATPVRLDWLRRSLPGMRQASRNPMLTVMVGGPLFVHDTHVSLDLDVDITARDAREAPAQAAAAVQRRVEGRSAALV
jgi:methanogenic corrinoid protein MtbC1